MDENFYEVLDVSSDADVSEIKRAYILKLGQFPNELYPEVFKKIRKAYETLSNPASRTEYDTMSLYGKEIEYLQSEANDAINDDDFQAAIACYKKILMIEPSLLHIRNQYAMALKYSGEYDKAIRQYERLLEIDPDSAVFTYNLAKAYEGKEDVHQAIYFYQKAFEIDPNDINIIFSIVDLYVDLREFSNARKVINEAIDNQSIEGFQQFTYLFKHLQVDLFAKDSYAIGQILSRIEALLLSHPEEKPYVANEFGKLASKLSNYRQYKWANVLTKKAIELDPENVGLYDFHVTTSKNNALFEEFERMDGDDRIIQSVKYPIFLYLYANEFSEEEFQENIDLMYESMDDSCKLEPENVISSIKRMNIKYPNLYEVREEFFQHVIEISEKAKNPRGRKWR